MKIRLGCEAFPTKQAALDYLCGVVLRYRAGEQVSDPDDEVFLLDVVDQHPRASEIKGCGIQSFEVRRKSGLTLSLWLTRHDGSRQEIDLRECVTVDRHAQTLWAMRNEVQDQLDAYCRQHGCHLAEYVGETFDDLVKRFLADRGIESVVVSNDGMRLDVRMFAKTWAHWHAREARLRPVRTDPPEAVG